MFSATLIVLAGWVFLNRQMLQDRIALASYEPSAPIAALANGADFSEKGERLFFVNEPELHGKKTFGKVCHGVGNEESNVLGCFTGNRIYVYDVPGGKLKGVEEVTSAHEMLHAAYVRLGNGEKERVNKLIKAQMDKHLDSHIEELIEVYEKLEPGQLMNEMHSILGTEQQDLLPELEAYYSQYFTDRKTVASLSASYRAVFGSLKERQDRLADRIDSLAKRINASTNHLNQQIEAYNAAVKAFNREARNGDMTAAEFDQRKAELDAELAIINQAIDNNNALRQEYRDKKQQYESLAVQFTELQNNISSSPVKPEDLKR